MFSCPVLLKKKVFLKNLRTSPRTQRETQNNTRNDDGGAHESADGPTNTPPVPASADLPRVNFQHNPALTTQLLLLLQKIRQKTNIEEKICQFRQYNKQTKNLKALLFSNRRVIFSNQFTELMVTFFLFRSDPNPKKKKYQDFALFCDGGIVLTPSNQSIKKSQNVNNITPGLESCVLLSEERKIIKNLDLLIIIIIKKDKIKIVL